MNWPNITLVNEDWTRVFRCSPKKNFLWKIVTEDQKYIFFANSKRGKSWVDLGQPSTSTLQQKNQHKEGFFLHLVGY